MEEYLEEAEDYCVGQYKQRRDQYDSRLEQAQSELKQISSRLSEPARHEKHCQIQNLRILKSQAEVLADQGTPGQRARVTVTCDTPAASCHVGTSVITVRVASGVELPFFPAILGRGAAVFSLDASHTVPIGQYVESGSDDEDAEP